MKSGYKTTEVGLVPDAWEVAPLGREIERLEAGVSVNSVDENLLAHGHEQSVLKTSAIAGGRFFPRESKKIALRDLGRATLSPRVDSIIISRMNTLDLVGECGWVPEDFPNLFLPDRLWMTRFYSRSRISTRWLAYILSSDPYRARIKELATGTSGSMKNIAKDSLLAMPIAYPSPSEQRAIAQALSDVDALLDGLDRLIAKKRDLKQAAMQQLLTGQTRLPGFHGEWDETTLGDLGQFAKGSGVTKEQARSGSLACVRYGELYTHHHDLIREFNSWISPAVASTAMRLRNGDILFAGSGETKEEIGKCAAFVSDSEAYAGGDIVILRPREADAAFLGYLLNTAPISRQKASRGQGDAVVHISGSALASIRCRLPKPAEQIAIATALREMDLELAALHRHRVKTRALKCAMMQELLTGKTRLVAKGGADA